MTTIWTFENSTKAELFIGSLQNENILFETQVKSGGKPADQEISILVAEADYERAKKLLIKHRRRKTSG